MEIKKVVSLVDSSLNCKTCLKNGRVCFFCYNYLVDIVSFGTKRAVKSDYMDHYKFDLRCYADYIS